MLITRKSKNHQRINMDKQNRNGSTSSSPITYLYVSGICLVLLLAIIFLSPKCDGYGCLSQTPLFLLVPVLAFMAVVLFIIYLIMLIMPKTKKQDTNRQESDKYKKSRSPFLILFYLLLFIPIIFFIFVILF